MKDKVWKAVLIASLLLVVISAINIVVLSREYQEGIDAYADLEKYANVTQETDLDLPDSDVVDDSSQKGEEASVNLDIDYDSLCEINSDFVGWIYYEPLGISYPIVLGEDNDYYTGYTFEKEKNSSGAIFMDFLNEPDFSQFNTIVYGHNMRNGTMFGSLKKLLNDKSIIENNPYIYVFTKEKTLVYEICSAYITEATSQSYYLAQTAKEQDAYLEYMKEVSDYYWDSSMLEDTPAEDTRLLTLSTCYGLHSQNRTVVHGVLIAEKDR